MGGIGMNQKVINIETIGLNPFSKIGSEWMLITAGDETKFNTMTASWGNMGVLWGKNVVTTYIRPQRYTKEFVDANSLFTITFFEERYKKALSLLGSTSGKDTDKVAQSGLTPFFLDQTVAFKEASLILVCKKLYHDILRPECFDEKEEELKCYPGKDYHTFYISEILKAYGTI